MSVCVVIFLIFHMQSEVRAKFACMLTRPVESGLRKNVISSWGNLSRKSSIADQLINTDVANRIALVMLPAESCF